MTTRVRQGLEIDTHERNRRRLAAVEREIENLVDLAAKTGASDSLARKLGALESERAELAESVAVAPPPLPTMDDLPELIEVRVRDFRSALSQGGPKVRAAMQALLGDRRIEVHSDAERGFRLEGLLHLPLMQDAPGVSSRGASSTVRRLGLVAGAGFAHLSPIWPLPWRLAAQPQSSWPLRPISVIRGVG